MTRPATTRRSYPCPDTAGTSYHPWPRRSHRTSCTYRSGSRPRRRLRRPYANHARWRGHANPIGRPRYVNARLAASIRNGSSLVRWSRARWIKTSRSTPRSTERTLRARQPASLPSIPNASASVSMRRVRSPLAVLSNLILLALSSSRPAAFFTALRGMPRVSNTCSSSPLSALDVLLQVGKVGGELDVVVRRAEPIDELDRSLRAGQMVVQVCTERRRTGHTARVPRRLRTQTV